MTRVLVVLTALTSALLTLASATAQQTAGTPGSPGATTTIDGRYLPPPPQPFQGETGLTAAQSKPAWPARVVPPKGAPNILVIIADDLGFGAPSTFGRDRRQRSTASRRTGCATPTSIRLRSARRRAPR